MEINTVANPVQNAPVIYAATNPTWIYINVLKEKVEENVEVYTKEECSILAEMGKYIPVQTNPEIKGDVLIEISNKTVMVLILLEIVYNIKKKLVCIFIENL